MSRATLKEQNLRNSEQLNKFYNEVLNSFIFRLYKDYRYKSNVQQDQITDLQKLVKSKINSQEKSIHSGSLFDIYLTKKQTTKDYNDIQLESNVSKDKTVYSEIKTEDIKKNEPVQKNHNGRTQEEEEEIDDLAEYHDQAPVKKEESVKHEDLKSKKEQVNQIQQKEIKEVKVIEENQSDSESINLIERAQQKIGTALMGTFSSFHIKRKPKQQKIFLQLQNVFLKYANTSNQNFFPKIVCELSKVEKEDIKQLKK